MVEGLAKGKVLDLIQSGPIAGHAIDAVGTTDYADTANSDIVIITAGVARKPGMTREDLVHINAGIVTDVVRQVVEHSPNAILLMMTNPLDTIPTWRTGQRFSARAGHGSGGRSRWCACDLSFMRRHAVLKHPTTVLATWREMVALRVRFSTLQVCLDKLLSQAQITTSWRVALWGEIVRYLKTGSAYYAPGASACRMAQAVLRGQHHIYPASVYLEGEYGLTDICFGVPVILGKNGIERIIELDLNDGEMSMLKKSADLIRATMAHLRP